MLAQTSLPIGYFGDRVSPGTWVGPGSVPVNVDVFIPDCGSLFARGAQIQAISRDGGRARLVNPAGQAFNFPANLLAAATAGNGSIPALIATSSFPSVGDLVQPCDRARPRKDPFFEVPVALIETHGLEEGTFLNVHGESRKMSLFETRIAREESYQNWTPDVLTRLRAGIVDPHTASIGLLPGGLAIGGVLMRTRHAA